MLKVQIGSFVSVPIFRFLFSFFDYTIITCRYYATLEPIDRSLNIRGSLVHENYG